MLKAFIKIVVDYLIVVAAVIHYPLSHGEILLLNIHLILLVTFWVTGDNPDFCIWDLETTSTSVCSIFASHCPGPVTIDTPLTPSPLTPPALASPFGYKMAKNRNAHPAPTGRGPLLSWSTGSISTILFLLFFGGQNKTRKCNNHCLVTVFSAMFLERYEYFLTCYNKKIVVYKFTFIKYTIYRYIWEMYVLMQ